ncbi:MAG: DUF167 domain-containing protein [Bryobacteraceae bacterium]|jgi:uncharacterized protein (TIGR00251 family)
MARITIKAHPRAARSAVAGRLGEAWKLRLAAPPAEGKANEECVRFLAELAGVARSRVHVISGATARTKIVDVEGVAQEELEARLERWAE